MLYGKVEKILNYRFKDKALLETALTHSSYANDFLGDAAKGNERLEFLGDAVLDVAIGLELFKRYPDRNEGFLTRLRSEIVCERSLGETAVRTGLNQFIRLGKGEENKGGRDRLSIAADAVEALIAAVFLDGGFDEASRVALELLNGVIEAAKLGELPGDYKTDLQVYCQKNGSSSIRYEIIDEKGPDHAKFFTAAVYIDGRMMGKGEGGSKKQAQTEAARRALQALEGTSAL